MSDISRSPPSCTLPGPWACLPPSESLSSIIYAKQQVLSRGQKLTLPSTDWFCVNRPAPVSCIRIGNASFLCSPLDLGCYRKGVVLKEFQQLCVLKLRYWFKCRENIMRPNGVDAVEWKLWNIADPDWLTCSKSYWGVPSSSTTFLPAKSKVILRSSRDLCFSACNSSFFFWRASLEGEVHI